MGRGRGKGRKQGWGERRGSGDGAGRFAENVLKAAGALGLVLISDTFLVCF